jgi:O-antigen ligase
MNASPRTSAVGRSAGRLAVPAPDGLLLPVVVVGGLLMLVGGAMFLSDPRFGLAALGLPALPVLVMYPAHALLVFIAAMPFDAVAALLPDRTLSLTRLLGVAVIGGWAVWVLVNRVRVQLTTAGLLLAGYVALAGLSYFWAGNQEYTYDQLQRLAQLFLLYLLTANLMTHLPTLERTLNVLIAATVVLGVLVLWQLPHGGQDLERATFTYGDQSFNPNYLAAALVLPAVAAAALGRTDGPLGWWRPAAILPIGAGLIAAGSRGGIVGFVAGIAVLLLARPRLGFRAVGGLLLVVAAAPLIVPPQMIENLLTRFTGAGADRMAHRLDIWKVAFAMIGDHFFLGTGFANFRDNFYTYMATVGIDPVWALRNSQGMRVAHNVYLSTFAELGVVGIGILLSAFAAHGMGALRVWRWHRAYGNPRIAALALALCCSLVSFLVFANTIDFMMRKTPWVMLGMIQGLILATQPGQGAARR